VKSSPPSAATASVRDTPSRFVCLDVTDRDDGDEKYDAIIGIFSATDLGVAKGEPQLVFSMRSCPVPYWTQAIPQYLPVEAEKAGVSTDDELKAAIFVANNAPRGVIVPRAEGQDPFAIDFRNVGLHNTDFLGRSLFPE
jgi:hypothetical protein